MPEEVSQGLSKYLTQGLLGTILVILLGGYIQINSLRVDIARLEERIAFHMNDAFTGTQGHALEARVKRLEHEMAEIYQDVRGKPWKATQD